MPTAVLPPVLLIPLHHISFQLDVVVVALVEKASFAGRLAVFDNHIVADAVETDVHFLITRNECAFIISGMVVDVVSCIVTVVQIQVASVVVAYGAVVRGVIADHADTAVGVLDVVLAVFVDVKVDARLFHVHDIVFVAAQFECNAPRIGGLCGGLHLHPLLGRYQIDLLNVIVDGFDAVYGSV